MRLGLARLVPGSRSSSSGRVACAGDIDPDLSASIAGTVCPSISRSVSIAGTECPSISIVQDRKARCITSIVQVAVKIRHSRLMRRKLGKQYASESAVLIFVDFASSGRAG